MADPACIAHLRDYVALPSINPMGRLDIPPELAGEARYANHVREQLRRLGVDAELVGPAERPSVLAHVRAPGARETVLVASHLDTVPVDAMQIPPFDPVIEAGRLYGRGSCDTKAGMAALLAALERVLPGRRLTRNLIVVGESDEEFESIGALAVADHVAARPPDWVLATEPTEMRVVTHHKGVAHLELVAHGRACHASAPREGASAIVALARAVLALEGHASALESRRDPLLGSPTLNVGQIRGGSAPNVVPDHCWLKLDRRLIPGETEQSVREELLALLAREGLSEIEITHCALKKPALGTPRDHASVRRCQRALRAAGQSDEPAIVAFGTDAAVFAARGIPGVVLGPGSITRAHTVREYVEIDQVEAMTEFFAQLLCGPAD